MTTVDILEHYTILEWLVFSGVIALIWIGWNLRRLGDIWLADDDDENGPITD